MKIVRKKLFLIFLTLLILLYHLQHVYTLVQTQGKTFYFLTKLQFILENLNYLHCKHSPLSSPLLHSLCPLPVFPSSFHSGTEDTTLQNVCEVFVHTLPSTNLELDESRNSLNHFWIPCVLQDTKYMNESMTLLSVIATTFTNRHTPVFGDKFQERLVI